MMPDPEIPVVSVIVPARNEEACLGICLESLATQSGVRFEIIVVDDASTDRTTEIARSFADRARSAFDVRHELSAPQGRASLAQDGSPGLRPQQPSSPGGMTALSGTLVLSHLTVITAPPLPENWTGKNNAMAAGAKIAKGKWLLFTDADTFHKPGSLARAVAEAEEHGVALLSYSPEQEVCTLLEKAVMPVIFAELAATYPPAKVRDPNSPIAAANGQYLMISREAYDAVGGHTKIASDLLEDVAMARVVKSSGRKIWFRYGGDAVRTRMYRTWSQMKEGWTKNLALLFKNSGELAFVNLATFVALVGTAGVTLRWIFLGEGGPPIRPFFVGLVNLKYHHEPTQLLTLFQLGLDIFNVAAFFLILGYLVKRAHHSGFSWPTPLVSPLGIPIFSYLLLRSHHAYKNARFDWKDRTYMYSSDEVRKMTSASSVGPSRSRRD